MSRPKRVTSAVMRICYEEAVRRETFRSNKALSREISERLGIQLTPQYIGKLVADERRRYRLNIRVRMFPVERSKTADTSGTIER